MGSPSKDSGFTGYCAHCKADEKVSTQETFKNFFELCLKKEMVSLCSATCCLAFLETLSDEDIEWSPPSTDQGCNCMMCRKGFTELHAHVARQLAPECDCPAPAFYSGLCQHLCGRENAYEELAAKALAETPRFRDARFLAMPAGYGTPLYDCDGYSSCSFFCSVECAKAFWLEPENRSYDAKKPD